MKQKKPHARRRELTPAQSGAPAGERAAELVLARELGMLIGKHLAAVYAGARDAAEAAPATAPRDK